MKILFCGCGALGSHALQWGRGLPCELGAIDFDRVETKNLASQWFVKQMVGKNKALALKSQMLNFYGIPLQEYTVRLAESNCDAILGGWDLIVDGFDNAASRRLLQNYARQHGKPCIHGGLAANGEFGVVRWDRVFAIDEEGEPGQPTCDGGEFLPLIGMIAAALIHSIKLYLSDNRYLNWNVSPNHAESFADA